MLDIGKVFGDNPKNLIIVNVPVDMNKPVSKTNHLDQRFDKFMREGLMFLHYPNGVGIILRRPESILRYDMIAEIHNSLDGHNEVIFGASNFMGIGKKFGFFKGTQFSEPHKGNDDFR